jgi:hypothetical protein
VLALYLPELAIRSASSYEILVIDMLEIEIQIVAGSADQFREQVDRLEAAGKRIRDIRFPGWAARDLGSRRGIAVPGTPERCWAEVRIAGSSDYAPAFWGCQNKPREGFLTCRVHYERELAARELKCETEGLRLANIAYTSLAEKEADQKTRMVAAAERLKQLSKKG